MGYYLDFSKLDLHFLKQRLSEENLIPSHLSLREALDENLLKFHSLGITTLAELRARLGNAKAIEKLSKESSIESGYLKLLNRVLNGYLPKPVRLIEYPNQEAGPLAALQAIGLGDSFSYWNAAHLKKEREVLSSKLGVGMEALTSLACLCDLSRIQWVSPLFACLLFEGGYASVQEISNAKPKPLVQAVAEANARLLLFKGKIGEKDMARLIYCATLLYAELER